MMLFAGDNYYANGGAEDFVCFVPSIAAAREKVIEMAKAVELGDASGSWAHVCDDEFRIMQQWAVTGAKIWIPESVASVSEYSVTSPRSRPVVIWTGKQA